MFGPTRRITRVIVERWRWAPTWSDDATVRAWARNGSGNAADTPDTIPCPPAATTSGSSVSLPEYNTKSSGTALT
ncbi:hypothetical protein GCM10027569_60780 [Flindersiella endophytica]